MPCNTINSTLEIFTIVLLCTLLAAIMLKKKRFRDDWFFFGVTMAHIINTAGDLAAWRFAGKSDDFSAFMAAAGNYTTYLFSVLAYTGFIVLIHEKVAGQKKKKKPEISSDIPERVFFLIIGILSAALIVLVLTNGMTGALYSISEDNVFAWGEWSTAFDNTVLVQMVLLFFFCLVERKTERKEAVSELLFYLSIPIVAMFLENWVPALMLSYPSVAISLLLFYVNSQGKQESELLRAKLQVSDSQAALVLSQIQPHFLYNSLNSIYHLCDKDAETAKQAVADFSEYLRGNLTALGRQEPIPFDKEMEHVKHYLALEQVRFGEELHVVYEIRSSGFFLPQLSVQPIVENAVKHGLGNSVSGGTVTIASAETEDCFQIVVTDDGIGFDVAELGRAEDGGGHVGLLNVKSRLWNMVGGTVDVVSEIGKGTCVTIKIPKE